MDRNSTDQHYRLSLVSKRRELGVALKQGPPTKEAHKEMMRAKQESLMQHIKEGGGDALCYSTDTSRWSTPSSLCCGSNSSYCSSDFEDLLINKTQEAKSLDKWQGPRLSRGEKDKKAQRPQRQVTNCTASLQRARLPAIKPLQVSGPRIQSGTLKCIRELKNQVCDLQQQLREARTENKLLKRLQHRHMVALQHYQDSENSLSQILAKHDNETRVLQGLLRETRARRDNLAKQLQTMENKFQSTKANLQHLQQLSQDQSLLEREGLTLRLTTATAELEERGKRIVDLERNLELCQASFNRQIVTEQKQRSDARKLCRYLQEQVYQLNREIQDKQKELDTYNIYSHRFQKGFTKRGRESKMVQTDELILLPSEVASLLELEDNKAEKREEKDLLDGCCYNPVQQSLVTESPEAEISTNHQEDTETCADTSEKNGYSRVTLEDQTEGHHSEKKATSETQSVLEETEEDDSELSYISRKSLNTVEPKTKGCRLSKTRHKYTFKLTTENLHSGRPAYCSMDMNPCENAKVEIGGVGSLLNE